MKSVRVETTERLEINDHVHDRIIKQARGQIFRQIFIQVTRRVRNQVAGGLYYEIDRH